VFAISLGTARSFVNLVFGKKDAEVEGFYSVLTIGPKNSRYFILARDPDM
jgi:hypothetical protein